VAERAGKFHLHERRFRAIVSSILIIVIARWGMDGGALAMKTIGEGLLGEYRRAKSDVQRSNGNSAAIYARLGTMHHASGCCRYAAGSRTLHSQCTPHAAAQRLSYALANMSFIP